MSKPKEAKKEKPEDKKKTGEKEEKKEEKRKAGKDGLTDEERKSAHDADLKLPPESQAQDHKKCGVCGEPEPEPKGKKEDEPKEEKGEISIDHVIRESDTSKRFDTHKRVLVTKKTLKHNPRLEGIGVSEGDVIQVRKEDEVCEPEEDEKEDLRKTDAILECKGGYQLRLDGELKEDHCFLGSDAFKQALAEFKRKKGL